MHVIHDCDNKNLLPSMGNRGLSLQSSLWQKIFATIGVLGPALGFASFGMYVSKQLGSEGSTSCQPAIVSNNT